MYKCFSIPLSADVQPLHPEMKRLAQLSPENLQKHLLQHWSAVKNPWLKKSLELNFPIEQAEYVQLDWSVVDDFDKPKLNREYLHLYSKSRRQSCIFSFNTAEDLKILKEARFTAFPDVIEFFQTLPYYREFLPDLAGNAIPPHVWCTGDEDPLLARAHLKYEGSWKSALIIYKSSNGDRLFWNLTTGELAWLRMGSGGPVLFAKSFNELLRFWYHADLHHENLDSFLVDRLKRKNVTL